MPVDYDALAAQHGGTAVGSYVTPSTAGGLAKGMLSPGNVDLSKRQNIDNGDGTHSTVFSMGVNIGGKEMLIPGVGDGKTYPLRKLSVPEAVDQYKKTGQHLGVFASPDASDAYAQTLHEDQARGNKAVDYDALAAQHGGTVQAPPPAPPDTRSLFQKAKDNFNANTQGAAPGDGAVLGAVKNFGAGAGDVVRAVAHPIDTLGSMANQGIEDLKNGMDPAAAQFARTAQSLYKQPARTLGQIGTGVLAGEVGGAVVAPIVRGAGIAADAAVDAASAAKAKVYPTSQSTVPAVSAARNLAKALVVSPQAAPSFIRAATDEAGTIVDYAQKNNLPINSKVDFVNASKAAADRVQSHFDALLEPSAKEIVPVPASYHGPTVGEGPNATLGAVNDRINAISSELKSNFRKPLSAQTSAANTSDADLIAEKSALTNLRNNKLAQATGLQPSDIASVSQQAGKLRTIADEANLSANTDLTAAGRQDAGGTSASSVGTKAGMIDRGWQMMRGGAEIVGNRQIKTALEKVSPQPMNLPQPTSTGVAAPGAPRTPISGPSTTIQGLDYTPDPRAADILRSRIQGRLKPKYPPQPMN